MDKFNYGALQVGDLGSLDDGGKVKVTTEYGATHWLTLSPDKLKRIAAIIAERES